MLARVHQNWAWVLCFRTQLPHAQSVSGHVLPWMALQNSLPTDSGSGQPGIIVLQLMLCKTGIRHYRKYFYIYKKKQYNHKEKNTTSTAWYNNMPWNVIGFIIIYYNLKNVLLSTMDRKCFHLTYGKHAVTIYTTKFWSLFFIHKLDDYIGIFKNDYLSSLT